MSHLFVIRHGMRLDHEDRSWKNGAPRPFDSPLSANGENQARATGQALLEKQIEAVYASPLLRTVQTGHAIAEALDLSLFLEGGLVEWLNPKWYDFSAGWLDAAQLKKKYPRLQMNTPQLVNPRYPEVEEETCAARVAYVARQLATSHQRPVALITHGIAVKNIVANLTAGVGQPNEQPCAINFLEYSGGSWRLKNASTAHLANQEEAVSFI